MRAGREAPTRLGHRRAAQISESVVRGAPPPVLSTTIAWRPQEASETARRAGGTLELAFGDPQTTPGSAAPPPTPLTRGKRPSPRTPARAASQRWSQSGAARARTARGRKTPRPRRIAVERGFARRGGHARPEHEAVPRCARGIAARGRRRLALAVLGERSLNVA